MGQGRCCQGPDDHRNEATIHRLDQCVPGVHSGPVANDPGRQQNCSLKATTPQYILLSRFIPDLRLAFVPVYTYFIPLRSVTKWYDPKTLRLPPG
jgi:hypothetical protein